MAPLISPQQRQTAGGGIPHIQTYGHEVEPCQKHWKGSNPRGIPKRNQKREERKHHLPERTAKDAQRSPKETEQKMATLMNVKKYPMEDKDQDRRFLITPNISVSVCSKEKDVHKKPVKDNFKDKGFNLPAIAFCRMAWRDRRCCQELL